MKLPFLSFTAHSCRNLARAQHLPCSGSRLFLLYHQRGRLNKVYFTRKLLFSHIPQHISGWQTKSFPLFYIHFTLYHLGCGMPPLTRPALPWPRAPYRPKTGTHHCRCIPPHDCHITQLKILHGVSLLCVCFIPGTSPVNTVSHNSDTIKRTFKRFCGFLRKKQRMLPSLLTLYTAIFLGDQVFGSPRSAAFPQETALELPFSVTPPPVKMG